MKFGMDLDTQRDWEAKDKKDMLEKVRKFFGSLSKMKLEDLEDYVVVWIEGEI